jgi:hypothetical protein
MQKSDDKNPEVGPPAPPKKPTWVAPRARLVGDVRDLVLGGGKHGSAFDMDPNNTTKRGMG